MRQKKRKKEKPEDDKFDGLHMLVIESSSDINVRRKEISLLLHPSLNLV